MTDKKRRSKNLVDPPVQKSLVNRMIVHWIVFVSAALTLTLLMQYFSNPFESFKWHLTELWWNQAPMILAMVALLPVFVLDSVKVSNKFVGPIKRMKETIADLSAGKDVEPLSFREGDFWHSLAHDFNKMVAQIKGQRSSAT